MKKMKTLILTARDRQLSKSKRHEAFGDLVLLFQDAAYEWAFSVLGDAHLAQDAVQEGFVLAYQKLEQLRQPAAFPGWLRQVIVSQSHRLIRGKTLATRPIDATTYIPTEEPGPSATIEDLEMKEKILTAIQSLSEHEQEVTTLFYLSGYSQKEISKLLEIPITTVKKRLQYARQNLRGILVSMFEPFAPVSPPTPVPISIPVQRNLQQLPHDYYEGV
ncbi:MAG: sigma-70 family RNA polymerase sigma factor [Chloroflexi bacterium]|nr:sigma-70 family RNA polymerase sigma factor [Chloroflexota bacterium]